MLSYTNVSLDPQDTAVPCGLYAKYYFTDTYHISKSDSPIAIDSEKIAYEGDRNHRFANHDNSEQIQHIDMEDGID